MIPVRQTRFAIETLGNCYEACVASILELPLTQIPDRADYIDADAWADLIATARRQGKDLGNLELPSTLDQWEIDFPAWLRDRGLARFGLIPCGETLKLLEGLDGYWIAEHRTPADYLHAVVRKGREVAWNPYPGWTASLGKLEAATVLVAVDPPLVARKLGPELLPDVAGQVDPLDNDFRGRMLADRTLVFPDGSWTRSR